MKKKKMSDLPRDVEEEVLCRIPLTSLGLVRSTCRRWNMLSRCDHLFANKHLLAHLAAEAAKKKDHPLVVTMMNYRVELMRLDLSNSEDDVAVVNPEAKLAGLDQIDVREIFHCDGLLFCIPKEDHYRLLVWNPYLGRGQPRWIEHTHNHDLLDKRLSGRLDSSKSMTSTLIPGGFLISLLVQTTGAMNFDAICFLVCFDFTTETFSPPLPLPFEAFPDDTLILSSSSSSSVGGEYPLQQLVVLFQSADTLKMEIWISNTIEQPNAALSWNSKEKKVAVVFDKDARRGAATRDMAYIFVGGGVDDDGSSSFKQQ
uniref:F-box domain-containing protein n=1 Tax=Brassica oleracea var. oleracea TaxID=109376 RepID=A0A0D3B129_BRAOL